MGLLTKFIISFPICFNIPHPIVTHISRCKYGHTIDELGIHLLCCLCGNEHTTNHDMIQDIVIAITFENGAHMQKKELLTSMVYIGVEVTACNEVYSDGVNVGAATGVPQ